MKLDKLYLDAINYRNDDVLRRNIKKYVDKNFKTKWNRNIKIRCLLYDTITYNSHIDNTIYTIKELESVWNHMSLRGIESPVENIVSKQLLRMSSEELKTYQSNNILSRRLQILLCYLAQEKPDMAIMPDINELLNILTLSGVHNLDYIPYWLRFGLTDKELLTCIGDVELIRAVNFKSLPHRQQLLCLAWGYDNSKHRRYDTIGTALFLFKY